ncbi:1-hydroxy-2-methyl-2-(e)-butenyl 4-diphosphate synthase [Theileria orientalis strain Shintoku]|uniref:4-hydroxy-3-methylbut-2-en-1-yl diphosphate synthase (ferredoxin), chloroplastic n=1 Tax=Theileria orientalis strain Shintoku TaxID=869250 RepID=J4C3G4_THEOR|nr:1-hydroxy-2-methyl-2-(e)-butenyl 4-diphosphate synthase [Theileria orientalis strain Shintoku]BAM40396.1 1-hydroxy-2-methyl-2-(e)-butenyl 4-diphosphate synthase [Theileria orientalis strain Shintoku]|eukprot:XP_009690697.1 1-hydroxy-2-methyl-2-(e)-butenyl 4-diphosphate synthase [Theileria orientalis strain Shintoku]
MYMICGIIIAITVSGRVVESVNLNGSVRISRKEVRTNLDKKALNRLDKIVYEEVEIWKEGRRRPMGFIGNKVVNTREFRLYNGNTEDKDTKYCENVYKRVRFPTRCVKIGKVTIGGNNPIALQTMTSCDTNDVKETVDQILKVQEYGADMVRLTVQSPREVKSSVLIKEKLTSLNCDIPLIADIHFNPKVALMSAEIYDKVRVNPGNYVDGRKNWDTKVYDSYEEFKKSGEYIEEMFTPLVEKCKQLKKAIRIGTNHGSLSSRVMSFYGDTPLGMVMSAVEFAEVCRKNDFHDFVFSMKSSNVFVMIHAYRLLVNEMYKRSWDYPIHLGVTEAGSVDDGRIKSCLGIGSLLIDGIGDTIRMSLTEDPWYELLPSRKLLESVKELYPEKEESSNGDKKSESKDEEGDYDKWRDFRNIERRNVKYGTSMLNYNDETKNHLLNPNGSVGTILNTHHLNNRIELYKSLGLDIVNGLPNKSLQSVDFVILEDVPYFHEYNKQRVVKELIEGGVHVISPIAKLRFNPIKFTIGLVTVKEYRMLIRSKPSQYYFDEKNKNNSNNRLVGINLDEENGEGGGGTMESEDELELNRLMNELNKFEKLVVKITGNETDEELMEFFNTYKKQANQLNNKEKKNEVGFIILEIDSKLNYMYTVRRIFGLINKTNCDLPVIHQLKFPNLEDQQDMLVKSCCLLGCNLIDKMGEGIIIKSKLPIQITNQLALNILQNSRMRNIKTDFISCPSCGRTLFNIQETTEEIRKRVGHLPGVTIAIMGCIVNGIGEMADADFGYVGGSPGKVDLYVKKKLIERNIPKEKACDKLIELIKQHNKWVEPVQTQTTQ